MKKPLFPQPKSFRAAHNVSNACFVTPPSFASKTRRPGGARADGIRYERKVQERLCNQFGNRYLPGVWLGFRAPDSRICQPDGLLFDLKLGTITIIEIKLRHCLEAYWQLEHLYAPVVRTLFPPSLWMVKMCEVCKWYDPAVHYPEGYQMREHIKDVSARKIGVHILNI